ncbi:hypothetical protein GCM10007423_63270 [Dyadobacter endophyticus]|uniref:Abortive phage infection protein C-terminal domain-containing protein n=1 Tax=Dyadobacter endophyticus TaxID=1749036 RepID=A0ABQ1ZC17_9BACT|nr:AIPR family protein [Dyadobacter endophyticus]GGH55582.1 hypothetical protein GCM10007423_63270 [Dyadobacter endophyticus]
MAKNDKILIDGIIDERVEQSIPSNRRDEAFEFFVIEQILKDYDLSNEELSLGIVDGRNDGGIDAFYVFINGHLLVDLLTFPWPKAGCTVDVFIATCKHHDTFKQAPLDNLAASLTELFDFSVNSGELQGDYSDLVLEQREKLKSAYRKVSPRLTSFSTSFFYASRGNVAELGESIISRSNQIRQIAEEAFGKCKASFDFLGATELIEASRKIKNFSLELPYTKDISSGENLILLVKLKDYFNFINDDGKLRRYLFDSNVRDYMGLNSVNEDIRESLESDDEVEFWWLNNGVTILATGASTIGEIAQIQDIQIVNGLQTSESIFQYFSSGGADKCNRSVLVKVIVSNDSSVRDSIIRATNNQTTVETSALHATDKIQRDIEDILKQYEYYYERRTNYYKNQGITADKIVAPMYLAAGYMALVLRRPHQAISLKSKFMRDETTYNYIFSPNVDLKVWGIIAHVLKVIDSYLETKRPKKTTTEKFLKSRRYILAFVTVSKIFGTFNYSITDLLGLQPSALNEVTLDEVWTIVTETLPVTENKRPKLGYYSEIFKNAESVLKIKDISRMSNLEYLSIIPETKINNGKRGAISMELALEINEHLPEQPWRPRMHTRICRLFRISEREYFDAVHLLIEAGLRYRQKDGVVFDSNGEIIAFDKYRVDPITLKLKEM